MSKYRPLLDHLASARTERQRLSFAAIEQILGFALPASARTYQAWWANDASNGRQSGAWLSAGWKTDELDLAGEKVTFQRSEPGQPAKPRTPARASFNEDDLEDVPGGGVRLSIDMRWRRLGAVIVGEGGALIFPRRTGGSRRSIGLRLTGATARTPLYRRERQICAAGSATTAGPAPPSRTSIRINELLHSHLAAGGSIEADIIPVRDRASL